MLIIRGALLIGRRLLVGRLLRPGLLRLRAPLLHALVLFVHLFAVLILLIAIENAHELLA